MPFFSIITPVYNREHLVVETIESILSQDFRDFELICVDDGSKDSTARILDELALKDSRIRVIKHRVNKGRSAARNTGIQTAKSGWICFLDSDDIYAPQHLTMLHNLITDNGSNYKAFATNQSFNNKVKPYPFKIKEKGSVVKLSQLVTHNFISLNQLCLSRDVKVLFDPVSISYSEDLLFMRKVLLQTNLLLIPQVTTDVPSHMQRSVLTEKTEVIANDNWLAAQAFVSINPDNRMNRKIMAHTALFCASILISAKEKSKSLSYLKYALKYFESYTDLLFIKVILKHIRFYI